MNPNYFGDSYDIVKRFFCSELRALGYAVAVDPMFTGQWRGTESAFFRFIGASAQSEHFSRQRRALFYDPDTGVSLKSSQKHVSLECVAQAAGTHTLVFAFDQSFSRQHEPGAAMRQKLTALTVHGCNGMYYDSHARFLFVSRSQPVLAELRTHLVSLGMPASRFVNA